MVLLATRLPVFAHDAEPLYQNERNGLFRYLFDCPVGVYETTLLEVETSATGPNQRMFNILINGDTVATNLDLFVAAGGQNIPVTLVFTNDAADSQLEMQFT